MRILILLAWLLVPVAVAAYHLGPGQERMVLDDAALAISNAQGHVDQQQWAPAVKCYDTALNLLPAEKVSQRRRLRLERAKAKMMNKGLPEAHEELIALVDNLQEDEGADPKLLAESRAALANSRYYITWLMRLEGLSRDEWEPEIEASRQTFRALAEESVESGDQEAAARYRADLESSIRLARMDLTDLQGLPLPSQ